MKELEEDTIEQIRTLLNYLEQTDLLKKRYSQVFRFNSKRVWRKDRG